MRRFIVFFIGFGLAAPCWAQHTLLLAAGLRVTYPAGYRLVPVRDGQRILIQSERGRARVAAEWARLARASEGECTPVPDDLTLEIVRVGGSVTPREWVSRRFTGHELRTKSSSGAEGDAVYWNDAVVNYGESAAVRFGGGIVYAVAQADTMKALDSLLRIRDSLVAFAEPVAVDAGGLYVDDSTGEMLLVERAGASRKVTYRARGPDVDLEVRRADLRTIEVVFPRTREAYLLVLEPDKLVSLRSGKRQVFARW